jgi:protein SCO1/2
MKSTLILNSILLFTTASAAPVAENPGATCCTVVTPVPACCANKEPAAPIAVSPANSLPALSIYHLEGKWTDDGGHSFSLSSLRGHPVVLAMFFASCEYACPVLVNDMTRLRALLPEDVRADARFVLVTFDTTRDTPEALKSFRERMTLDGGWTLLRSDAGAVRELAMVLGVKYRQDARGQFAHSNLLTVLNREGEVAHQLAGLNGDVSEAARAVSATAKIR